MNPVLKLVLNQTKPICTGLLDMDLYNWFHHLPLLLTSFQNS